MLKIFNNLAPFIEDNYRRINVREYARLQKISPPSASKLLSGLQKEDLLVQEAEKNYLYYKANRENKLFVGLSQLYWLQKLQKIGLLDYLQKELVNPGVILFGSLSKAEATKDSDLDLAVFSISSKKLDLRPFERKLNRKIQLFLFKDKRSVGSQELMDNIMNGYRLGGRI